MCLITIDSTKDGGNDHAIPGGFGLHILKPQQQSFFSIKSGDNTSFIRMLQTYRHIYITFKSNLTSNILTKTAVKN